MYISVRFDILYYKCKITLRQNILSIPDSIANQKSWSSKIIFSLSYLFIQIQGEVWNIYLFAMDRYFFVECAVWQPLPLSSYRYESGYVILQTCCLSLFTIVYKVSRFIVNWTTTPILDQYFSIHTNLKQKLSCVFELVV